jgi:glucosyl-dolichyl phosphate glucuronosyltransferase
MTSVSIIICTYNHARWNFLVGAVESALTQGRPADEVIVVVDHNPELLALVQSIFPGVIALENQEERGLSGARNTGIAAASGEIIAFMDDDAQAASDWLDQLISGYADPQVIGVGGSIEPQWPGSRPGWFPREFDWVVGCTYRGLPEQAAPVRNLIGANMSFRREVFSEVTFYHGIGHNNKTPLGGSDPDFCIRVKQRWPDKVLLYQPGAKVFHQVSENRTKWSYFRLRCYNEGLSKSLLAERVGSKDGLSSERSYVLHTLPVGVARGLVDAVRGDINGISRTGSLIAGLAFTSAGYMKGTLSRIIRDGTALTKEGNPR